MVVDIIDDQYYAAVNWKSEGFADRTWREFLCHNWLFKRSNYFFGRFNRSEFCWNLSK